MAEQIPIIGGTGALGHLTRPRSNVSPAALADRGRIVDDFRELGERAAARGLRVAFEALAWGRHVSDHRDAWEVVRRADHPAVGLILDSFHTLARNIDLSSIRSIPADKLFIVQLADAPKIVVTRAPGAAGGSAGGSATVNTFSEVVTNQMKEMMKRAPPVTRVRCKPA